jgi:type I restriction enzyme, S subunit
MSSEWSSTRLSDLGTFDRGKSKHRPRDAAHLYGGAYPFIQTGDIAAAEGRITKFRQTYSEAGLAQSKLWPVGTLCITIAANIAETALLTFPACFPDSVVGYTADSRKADIRFVEYLFRAFRENVKSKAYGSVQENINLEVLRSLSFPVPPLREQVRIAEFLTLLDDRIALLRETSATLEAIAQALFKSWFVDFDPVRAKHEGRAPEGMDEACAALFPNGFEESELGVVPRGWHVSDLVNLLASCGGTIQTGPFGSQLHASDYVESGIPVVMPKDIQRRRVDAATTARIRPEDADRLERHKLKPGDIVFSRRGDVERHALIGEREVGWLCGTGCLLVRPGPSFLSSSFLSMTLDAPRARQWLVQHAVGATMPNLNTSILGSVPALLPDAKVLGIFEDIVSATEAQLTQNSELANTLSSIRDTLLPRLISGQLRLSEAEALVA